MEKEKGICMRGGGGGFGLVHVDTLVSEAEIQAENVVFVFCMVMHPEFSPTEMTHAEPSRPHGSPAIRFKDRTLRFIFLS